MSVKNDNWNTRGNQWAVYPGRNYDWNGEPLYIKWKAGTVVKPTAVVDDGAANEPVDVVEENE